MAKKKDGSFEFEPKYAKEIFVTLFILTIIVLGSMYSVQNKRTNGTLNDLPSESYSEQVK